MASPIPTPDDVVTFSDVLKFVGGGGIGGVVGAIITHIFTTVRERGNRKRVFLGFIKQWRREIDGQDPDKIDPTWAVYHSTVPRFYNALGHIEMDYVGDTAFTQLTIAAGTVSHPNFRDYQADKGDRRDLITGPLDRLAEHIKQRRCFFTNAA